MSSSDAVRVISPSRTRSLQAAVSTSQTLVDPLLTIPSRPPSSAPRSSRLLFILQLNCQAHRVSTSCNHLLPVSVAGNTTLRRTITLLRRSEARQASLGVEEWEGRKEGRKGDEEREEGGEWL
eukprot:1312876-Rhodomonas_salina.1